MRKIARYCVCLYIFLVWTVPTCAEQANQNLSLTQALHLAYEQNPQMRQAREAIKGAKGDLLSKRTWMNPEIEAEFGGFHSDSSKDSGHLDSLTITQPLRPLGTRYLNSKIAQNNVSIQEQMVKQIWSEVYVDVRNVYGRLILNQKELVLKQKNLRSMRQFFSDVQLRYQGGQALKNHVQRAKIELLKAESDYLGIVNELEINKAQLNLLIGREQGTPFEINDYLEEENLGLNLDALIELALANRPDLNINETLVDSTQKRVAQENLSRLPSYSLGFQINDEDERDYRAIVAISIPLWNLNQGEVKKSKAERDTQRIKFESLKNEIAFDVFASYKQAKLALKQLDLHKKSLAEANEMFRLAGLRYGEGHIDFLNYLDQVLVSLNSRVTYYQGLYQLNQSISNLERAIFSSLRGEEFLQ